MAGTREGGLAAARTNKAVYGPDFYRKIGQKGGKLTGIRKGFAAMEHSKFIEASRKGGTTSRKGRQ